MKFAFVSTLVVLFSGLVCEVSSFGLHRPVLLRTGALLRHSTSRVEAWTSWRINRAAVTMMPAISLFGEDNEDEDEDESDDGEELDLDEDLNENDLREMLGDGVGRMLEIVVKDAMDGGNGGVFFIKEGMEEKLKENGILDTSDEDEEEGDENSGEIEDDPRVAALRAARIGGPENEPFMKKKPKKKSKKSKKSKKEKDALRSISEFDLTPREIVDHLDKNVIRQSEAKRCLAVAVCDHYNRVRRMINDPKVADRDFQKPNVLLLGPTGVGKTYLMRNIAKLIGVPLVKADATKFTETGYVGEDAEDLVRELVTKADGNVELAQYGMIYVDEVDKIAAVSNDGMERGGVNSRSVQNNFLKILEDTDVSVTSQRSQMMMGLGGPSKQQKISTRNILFIFSGAFNGLNEELRRKHDTKGIGFDVGEDDKENELSEKIKAGDRDVSQFGIVDDDFIDGKDNPDKSYLRLAETADFVKAGLEPEFVGRIPVRVTCDPLSEQGLFEVLTQNENSVLHQYVDDFKGYNIDLQCDKEALREMARQAFEEKTGARGLLTVLERTFRDFKYELPSTTINAFRATEKLVKKPREELERLMLAADDDPEALAQAELLRWALPLLRTHGINVTFADDAVVRLMELSREGRRRKSIRFVVGERLAGLPSVLKEISGVTGSKSFEVSLEMVDYPELTMQKWMEVTNRVDQQTLK